MKPAVFPFPEVKKSKPNLLTYILQNHLLAAIDMSVMISVYQRKVSGAFMNDRTVNMLGKSSWMTIRLRVLRGAVYL